MFHMHLSFACHLHDMTSDLRLLMWYLVSRSTTQLLMKSFLLFNMDLWNDYVHYKTSP